jgi:hypothetical protein
VHEYACLTSLVKVALDEDESLCPSYDTTHFHLVGRQLPFDKPVEDGKAPIWIFKVQLGWLVDLHDLGPLLLWAFPLHTHGWHVVVTCEHAMQYWFAA